MEPSENFTPLDLIFLEAYKILPLRKSSSADELRYGKFEIIIKDDGVHTQKFLRRN